jgi:outer membrane protein OmpA-like peptidoglycan-associated protein
LIIRPQLIRAQAIRPRLCVGTDCTDAVVVPPVVVPPAVIDTAVIDSAVLDSYVLPSTDAKRLQNDRQTAYVAPADVLFDFDRATLKPEAVPTLRAIATDLTAKSPDRPVRVEGHTDGMGEHGYNQRLSDERARAVAAWLTSEGQVPAARITTAGLAETVPVAPNRNADGSDDPAGRQANRRVVISVANQN